MAQMEAGKEGAKKSEKKGRSGRANGGIGETEERRMGRRE